MIISDRKIRYRKHIVSGLLFGLEIGMEGLVVVLVRCLDNHHAVDSLLL